MNRFLCLPALLILSLFLLATLACDDDAPTEMFLDPSPGPGGALPLCDKLGELERYRYTFRYQISAPEPDAPVDTTQVGNPPFAISPNAPAVDFVQTYDGMVVTPDRYHVAIATDQSAAPLELIVIGDQSWNKLQENWSRQAGEPYVPFPPQQMCQAILGEIDLAGREHEDETVNGVPSRHYALDEVEAQVGASIFGSQSDTGRLLESYDVDLWLAADGLPVRLEAGSQARYPSGRELSLAVELNITDVNSGEIRVESPE